MKDSLWLKYSEGHFVTEVTWWTVCDWSKMKDNFWLKYNEGQFVARASKRTDVKYGGEGKTFHWRKYKVIAGNIRSELYNQLMA